MSLMDLIKACCVVMIAGLVATAIAGEGTTQPLAPAVERLNPPLRGFFEKRIDLNGIPILAAGVVADEALVEAHRRLGEQLAGIPVVHANLAKAGAEMHIIGKDQVPSDLPELREYKGKPFDGAKTIDERTRGVGGLMSSCGEENLLRLENDRYCGRDICVHEFAHCIFEYGVPESVRQAFEAQRVASLAKGRWVGAYAGTNRAEFFAELTMWYFGTRGDLNMKGDKPADGREGLRTYDADAHELMERFYSGRMDTALTPVAPDR